MSYVLYYNLLYCESAYKVTHALHQIIFLFSQRSFEVIKDNALVGNILFPYETRVPILINLSKGVLRSEEDLYSRY